MSTYKSFQIQKQCESAKIVEVPFTPLPDKSVRVKVLYSSFNPADARIFGNADATSPGKIGFDVAGIVTETASAEFTVGDHVFGNSPAAGAISEYVAVPQDYLVRYNPQELPSKVAGSLTSVYESAWEPLLLVGKINERKGQWIYIAGGAGGVGHSAVQLAKIHGLKVISSAGKKEGLDYLKSLNIEGVIDYKNQDVVAEIRKLTGSGVDVSFDSTYASSSLRQSVRAVKQGGLFLRLGPLDYGSTDDKEFILQTAQQKNLTAAYGDLGRYFWNPEFISKVTQLKAGLQEAVDFYKKGLFSVLISKVIPFENEPLFQGLKVSLSSLTPGKVAIEVSKQ